MSDKLNFGDHVRLKALDFSLEMSRSLIFASVTIVAGIMVLLGERQTLRDVWEFWGIVGSFGITIIVSFVEIIVSYNFANRGDIDLSKRHWLFLKILPIIFFIVGCGLSVASIFATY